MHLTFKTFSKTLTQIWLDPVKKAPSLNAQEELLILSHLEDARLVELETHTTAYLLQDTPGVNHLINVLESGRHHAQLRQGKRGKTKMSLAAI